MAQADDAAARLFGQTPDDCEGGVRHIVFIRRRKAAYDLVAETIHKRVKTKGV